MQPKADRYTPIILRKAAQQAEDNGFNKELAQAFIKVIESAEYNGFTEITRGALIRGFIFDTDFAKALWGEKPYGQFQQPNVLSEWEYHLQQMVIDPDPIEYLGRNI